MALAGCQCGGCAIGPSSALDLLKLHCHGAADLHVCVVRCAGCALLFAAQRVFLRNFLCAAASGWSCKACWIGPASHSGLSARLTGRASAVPAGCQRTGTGL